MNKNEQDKMVPHNSEQEFALLGGLTLDPDWVIEVREINLLPEDMFIKTHQHVLRGIYHLFDTNGRVDALSLSEYLVNKGVADLFDLADMNSGDPMLWLMELPSVTAIHTMTYAKHVKECSIRRKEIESATQYIRDLYDMDKPLDESITGMTSRINNSDRMDKQDLEHIGIAVDEYLDIQEAMSKQGNNPLCVSTYLDSLDRVIGGWHERELTVLGGRAGMGKTAVGIELGMRTSSRGNNVAFFSAEMGKLSVVNRMGSIINGANSFLSRMGKTEFSEILRSSSVIRELPFYIDDTPAINIESLKAKAKRLNARLAGEGGLRLIIVDHMQRLKCPSDIRDRRLQVGYIARELKTLAGELNCSIMAISQLNRAVESKQDKRPSMSHLREAGTIEEEADSIILLYRDEYYTKEDSEFPGIIAFMVEKNRNGEVVEFKTWFDKTNGQITDINIHAEAQKLREHSNGNRNGAMPPQPDFIKKELF